MFKKLSVYFLVSAATTFAMIILEIVVHSAVLSPFILLNAKNKEFFSQQLLVGYSSIQGNYLLIVRNENGTRDDLEKQPPPSAQFKLGNSTYTFYTINLPEVVLDKEGLLRNNYIEVITRRGIIASFNNDVALVNVHKDILFNRYQLKVDAKNIDFNIELKSEYSSTLILAVLLFTIVSPGTLFALSKIASRTLDTKNNSLIEDLLLVIIFLPFILSVIVPAVLNYYYVIGSILLCTDSYLASMTLSILLPVFLSLFMTIQVANYLTRHSNQDLKDDNKHYDDEYFLSERDKWAIFISAVIVFVYFYILNFVLPLGIQAKIMYDLLLFSTWFLSLSIIIYIGYNYLHYYMGNYIEVNNKQLLESIKYLENKTCTKIHLFLKQHSKNENNAWVYNLKSLLPRHIYIYLTEGVFNNFNTKEITAILSHEIGHIKLNHTRYAFLLSWFAIFSMGILVFYSRKFMLSFGWWQYLAVMTVFIFISTMITQWLPNTVSKKLEHKADEYAVKLIGDKELYINTLIKMHKLDDDDNISIPRREWRETHPSLQKRIDYLEKVFSSGENYG